MGVAYRKDESQRLHEVRLRARDCCENWTADVERIPPSRADAIERMEKLWSELLVLANRMRIVIDVELRQETNDGQA